MNDELLDHSHYHDPSKPYMSLHDRAAQFMPFKPLNRGHDYDLDGDGGDEGRAEIQILDQF